MSKKKHHETDHAPEHTVEPAQAEPDGPSGDELKADFLTARAKSASPN